MTIPVPILMNTIFHNNNYSGLGGAFSPSGVSGLALWLDASDSDTITLSGSDITAWADKSDEGNDAVDAGAGQEPELITAGKNGLDVAEFDHVVGSGMVVAADATIDNLWDGGGYAVFVAKVDSVGGSAAGRYLTKEQWTIDFREGSGSFVKINFLKAWTGNNYVARSSSADVAILNYYIVEVSYDADLTTNDAVILINGVVQTTTEIQTPTSTRTSDAANDLGVGCQSNGGSGVSIDGRYAEALLYSTEPTDDEKTEIRNYLNDKWAIY